MWRVQRGRGEVEGRKGKKEERERAGAEQEKSVEWRSRRSGGNKMARTQEQKVQGKIEYRLEERSVEKKRKKK